MVLNWKARWFVLLPDRLMYYKYEGGKKDSSKRGTILLAGCVITSPFLVHENRPVSPSNPLYRNARFGNKKAGRLGM